MAEKVSLKNEIDYNPKPEDAGKIKVYVSILMSEAPIRDCRPVLRTRFLFACQGISG
ncbi:unnamed protein product [Arabidopsis halleri]